MKSILLSTIISTMVLFFWSGMTQMLPWGVPSAQNVNVQTLEDTKQIEAPNMVRLDPNSLTTDKFEEQFTGRVSIYSTDDTYSWIVTNPVMEDYSGYFAHEFLTQLLVGFLLSIVLYLTISLGLKSRMLIIGFMALCAVAGTYGQLMNWWGLPARYGLGVGLNLMIGWLLTSFLVSKFIIKTKMATA